MKSKATHHHHHDLSEIEDDFEEFEEPAGSVVREDVERQQMDAADEEQTAPVVDREEIERRRLEAHEKVTIWMNSWMDDDDGDFGPTFAGAQIHQK